jgi:uncharacterized protein YcgI (DUF1989 family)
MLQPAQTPTRTRVPAREGRAVAVARGQALTITDLDGGQIGDTWAFVADDVEEYVSAEHTRVGTGSLMPTVGEDFLTNRRRPILRFEADTSPGHHDFLVAACDSTRYAALGATGWHASCQENLLTTMAAHGYPDVDVPQPINVFMNTPFLPDGKVRWLPTATAPGDHVVFRALLDCIVVVSACPQDMTGINRRPGPLLLDVR